jgi:hypothetical protein
MNIAASALDTSSVSIPPPSHVAAPTRLTHLQQLEAESIHIIREAVAESTTRCCSIPLVRTPRCSCTLR